MLVFYIQMNTVNNDDEIFYLNQFIIIRTRKNV
jgi:hypothetical protein